MKSQTTYTYLLKRRCPCGEPIPDQCHKARKYCLPFTDQNGKKIVHKEIYTAEPKKRTNEPYRSLFNYYKRNHQNLTRLWHYKVNGENRDSVVVTIEELQAHFIDLSRPVKFKIGEDKKTLIYFVEFILNQIDQVKFKMFKHGIKF
jgi:hypothetical protein